MEYHFFNQFQLSELQMEFDIGLTQANAWQPYQPNKSRNVEESTFGRCLSVK